MRINKFLSLAGYCSRRHADLLIRDGQVIVNGHISTLGQDVNPQQDTITINRQRIVLNQPLVYIMLNKPLNVLSTTEDDSGRKFVTNLVDVKQRLYPVGRLDFNSTGLMLLTNDGDLALKLTHPRYHLPKIYQVTVDHPLNPADLRRLTIGVPLEDGLTLPCKINMLGFQKFEITLHQGKKRQIRRMLEHFNYQVKSLHRISIGPLKLGKLKTGQWRPLTPTEIKELKAATSHNR